jgi:hypothetical protein
LNRKLVFLNVVLLALLIWLGIRLRESWLESKAREDAALARAAKPGQQVAPPSVPTVAPASAAEYIDVAQRMLFSKDRDPNVLIDAPPPPPPPPPEPPVPTLPKYYGQMSFDEPVILLSTVGSQQKSFRVGDKVGEFKLAAFDRDTVTLEWRDKMLKNNLKDLTPKEAERPVQAATPAPAPAAAQTASITKMGGGAAAVKSDPALGAAHGIYRECLPSDTSPAGTVKDGFTKRIIGGLMGTTCQWEPIR